MRVKNPKLLHRVIGFDPQQDDLPSEFTAAIDDFVGHLTNNHPPPPQLSDMMVDGRGDFLQALDSPMRIETVTLQTYPASQREVYLISPRHVDGAGDWPWQLVVESSLTAAEIIRRRWGLHKTNVVRELAKRGIPFRTLLLAPSAPLSLPSEMEQGLRSGLGVRWSGFRISPEEYAVYEDKRNEHLLRYSHTIQAALCAGGIIWRLTMERLPPVLAVEGPQGEHDHQATVLLDGRTHVTDALTQHEEDLICGVYKVLGSEVILLSCLFKQG